MVYGTICTTGKGTPCGMFPIQSLSYIYNRRGVGRGGGRGGRLQTERYVRIVGRLCLYPYHNNQKFKTFTFISAILFDIDIENVFHLFIKDYTSTLMNLNEKIGGNQCKTRF